VAILADQALILRRYAYGETSLILHVLTPGHGRVHLLAKGAYRQTARYFAALDLFDTLAIEWAHAPRRDLQTLRAAAIERRRHALALDPERFRAGTCVIELLELGSYPEQPSQELFGAGARALEDLMGSCPPVVALAVFELSFLLALGLAPHFDACASCGRDAPPLAGETGDAPRVPFSAGAGGRLCARCAIRARADGRRVGTLPEPELARAGALLSFAVSRARLSAEGPDAFAAVLAADLGDLSRAREIVARFLEYHLESRPRSYRKLLGSRKLSSLNHRRPHRAGRT
jgi:DNA repair protein RecO (recombination protein O)